jgi:hypothetical protein
MTSAGTPLRRSARPGWYGSGSPTRARTGPSVLASWTAPSASASHSRGLAPDEDWAGTCRLTRTLAPGILSLARLSMSFRISAEREGVIPVACGRCSTTRGQLPRPRPRLLRITHQQPAPPAHPHPPARTAHRPEKSPSSQPPNPQAGQQRDRQSPVPFAAAPPLLTIFESESGRLPFMKL